MSEVFLDLNIMEEIRTSFKQSMGSYEAYVNKCIELKNKGNLKYLLIAG